MTILSDGTLRSILNKLLDPADLEMVNPASVDIRIGKTIIVEKWNFENQSWEEKELNIEDTTKERSYLVPAGMFLLASTYEVLRVPYNMAVELKLKSSKAREGWNHSLAFWFDPGWDGIGTMELKNITQGKELPLYYKMPIAQIIVHYLDKEAEKPYSGRYQNAVAVEASKMK